MIAGAVVLADFGSTFTKVTLVDTPNARLLGAAQRPTSVATDVMEGFEAALTEARRAAGNPLLGVRLASSSAAGGLRMVAVGLVADLTGAAAQQAALNAGARVHAVLAGEIGADDLAMLHAAKPELVLFAGGTDGGNRDLVIENAAQVAPALGDAAVVVACNADVAAAVCATFANAGAHTVRVPNVLPSIATLDVEPARAAIRELFIRRVTRAKGLSHSAEFFDAVVMPTPDAVLRATELLAAGDAVGPGVKELVVVDVGGATTDVHSVTRTGAADPGVRTVGLPTSGPARTVEGDLGVRWNAPGVVAHDGDWLAAELGITGGELLDLAEHRHREPAYLPGCSPEREADRALAAACVAGALRRHAGELRAKYVAGQGTDFVRHGRDLRHVRRVLGTGGVLARDAEAVSTLRRALRRRTPGSLTPHAPELAIDDAYLLAPAGLLSTIDPGAALRLLRGNLKGLE